MGVEIGWTDQVAVVALFVLVDRNLGALFRYFARRMVFIVELLEGLVDVFHRRKWHGCCCPLAFSGTVGVERDLNVEAFFLDNLFWVINEFHSTRVENSAFQTQTIEPDALEVSVLLLEFLSALCIFIVNPSEHEHVTDFEFVFLWADVLETHDFLLDRVDKALWIEHTNQFVTRLQSVSLADEGVEFGPALFLLLVPCGDGAHHPGDFLACSVEQPCLWDLVVVYRLDGFSEVSSHDDFTLDRCSHAVERYAHDFCDADLTFDLELVEDIQWIFESPAAAHRVVEHVAFLIQFFFGPDHVDILLVILRFLSCDQPVNDCLRRSTCRASGFLGLYVDHSVDKPIDLNETAVEVRERVHVEGCWIVRVLDAVEFVKDPVVDTLELFQL